MISLPERTDKRDAFAVTAGITGFDYNITDGVDGSKISTKALPYTMNQSPNSLGCWRAHLNVWQDMIHRGVRSTLVFEDDADWDVGLRAQMLELAKGTRHNLYETEPATLSPYGDDWDLLWIGHCGSGTAPWTTRRYVIHNDATVLPPDARNVVGKPDMSRYESAPDGDNSTRIIYQAMGGVCTAAYAISLKGAMKALYRTSLIPYNDNVDWGLSRICGDRSFGFKCVAAYPSIVGVYSPAGNTSRGSDIGYGDQSQLGIDKEGHSKHLVFSTRANLERLFHGERVFESSYSDESGPTMKFDDIISAVGQAVEIPPHPQFSKLTDEQLREFHWDWVEGLE